MAVNVSMKQLLEAGTHFGHQTRRWNPKMKPYIFGAKNGIYIIDLQKTMGLFRKALAFLSKASADGATVLFVGTKKQAQSIMQEAAQQCGMYSVTNRWLGGMLTNFETIRKRIDRLNELDKMEEGGLFEVLPKKEVLTLKREKEKLSKNLTGIKDMGTIPDIMFLIDPKKEAIALREAQKLGITVVAMVDTNCDPDGIDYVIPANDDAIRSIKLIVGSIAEAVTEGNEIYKRAKKAEEDAKAAEKAKAEKEAAARKAKAAEAAAVAAAEKEKTE